MKKLLLSIALIAGASLQSMNREFVAKHFPGYKDQLETIFKLEEEFTPFLASKNADTAERAKAQTDILNAQKMSIILNKDNKELADGAQKELARLKANKPASKKSLTQQLDALNRLHEDKDYKFVVSLLTIPQVVSASAKAKEELKEEILALPSVEDFDF